MKKVQAYEALGGSLHKTRRGAAVASLVVLGDTKNDGIRIPVIDWRTAEFIVANRIQIIGMLEEIDMPELLEPSFNNG